MVLAQKTSPSLHIGCFVINHVPQVSIQGSVKERTGKLCPFAAPAVHHEFWASSFLRVPIGELRGGHCPKDAEVPSLHTQASHLH